MDEKLSILNKFNFWSNNTPDLGYLRTEYTDKIADYTGNRLIKVLVGQRRTGKSYLLRQVAKKLIDEGVSPINILFINKEFTDFEFLSNYIKLDELIKLYKSEMKPVGRIYIFIDEVQNIEGWEKVINSYSQDYTENYEFFITGSNSKMISTELSTILSGRYINFAIFPFSYLEFTGITKKEQSKTSYIEYMSTGGLPELFSLPNPETRRNYISAIKDTVLLRDIIQRQNIREPKLLEVIFFFWLIMLPILFR